MNNPIVFSTSTYRYLCDKLVQVSQWQKGHIKTKLFPDGESYHQIQTPIRNKDIILIGGTIDDINTLELYDLAHGIVQLGARSLCIIIPYFGYATMERATQPGEIVKARNRAILLSSIPNCSEANSIYLLDVHSEGIPFYFTPSLRCTHMYAKELIIQSAKEIAGSQFVLGSTDSGRAKWVESLASDMGVDSAFVYKKRLDSIHSKITGVNADVQHKTVVIYDDMIRTGGSLINAALAYHNAGASRVVAITTHGLFSNNALDKINNQGIIEQIICTDSHAHSTQIQHPLLTIKSIDSILYHYLSAHYES